MSQMSETLKELQNVGFTCDSWLEQTISDNTPAAGTVIFSEDDYKSLPNYDHNVAKEVLARCKSVRSPKSASKWSNSMAEETISCNVLALFVHVICGSEGAVIPCQADVNGKRFVSLVQSWASTCGISAVPYLLVPTGVSCRVLPMTLKDSMSCTSVAAGGATGLHDCEQILKAFKVTYGDAPSKEQIEAGGVEYIPSTVFMMFLIYVQETFDLNDFGGWKKLSMAIARHIWPEKCAEKLNTLCLPKDKLPAFTLAMFSSFINLKLAFLVGESYVTGVHKLLREETKSGKIPKTLIATTRVMEPKGASFNHVEMKSFSNMYTTHVRGAFTPGTIMDFVLEALVEYTKETDQGLLSSSAKDYRSDLNQRIKQAFERFLQAAKYNLELKKLKTSYEQTRNLHFDDPTTTGSQLDGDGNNDVDDSLNNDVISKLMVAWQNPNALLTAGGPLEIAAIVMILTDFSTKPEAEKLLNFLQTPIGKSFFPSAPENFSSYKKKLHGFNFLRKDLATRILKAFTKQNGVQLMDIKIQCHRLARKISLELFRTLEALQAQLGEGMEMLAEWRTKEWKSKYKTVSAKLATAECKKDRKDGSGWLWVLHAILVSLIDAAQFNSNDNTAAENDDTLRFGLALNPELTRRGEPRKRVDRLDQTLRLEQLFTYGMQHGMQRQWGPFDLLLKILTTSNHTTATNEVLMAIEAALAKQKEVSQKATGKKRKASAATLAETEEEETEEEEDVHQTSRTKKRKPNPKAKKARKKDQPQSESETPSNDDITPRKDDKGDEEPAAQDSHFGKIDHSKDDERMARAMEEQHDELLLENQQWKKLSRMHGAQVEQYAKMLEGTDNRDFQRLHNVYLSAIKHQSGNTEILSSGLDLEEEKAKLISQKRELEEGKIELQRERTKLKAQLEVQAKRVLILKQKEETMKTKAAELEGLGEENKRLRKQLREAKQNERPPDFFEIIESERKKTRQLRECIENNRELNKMIVACAYKCQGRGKCLQIFQDIFAKEKNDNPFTKYGDQYKKKYGSR